MGTPQESGIPVEVQRTNQTGPNNTEVPTDTGKYCDKDQYSIRELYQENLGSIYRYIYSKVGNREEAEDLTSQTFMKALRLLDTVHQLQSMQGWLFQVARTTVADYWRVRYRVAASSLDALLDAGWEGPVHEEINYQEQVNPEERVQRILALLPTHYREVLNCRFLLNLSIKETASHMGLTETNVKVLQFRALKRAADLKEGGLG